MNKKLVVILVVTLLITTAIQAVGTMIEIEVFVDNPKEMLLPIGGGLDQKQTKQDGRGFKILPSHWLSQGFKPTKEKLAAVQLYIFKGNNPPVGIELTVSVRDSLNGSDLTETSVSADQIEDYKWVTFNFPEISVTPEEQYYIVCRSDGGTTDDCYCWFFGSDNPYDRGDAWYSVDEGLNWDKFGSEYQDPDFCFKTYSKKPRDKAFEINMFFLRFLENHPRIFPILQQLLGL